jgi:hypothetical protein
MRKLLTICPSRIRPDRIKNMLESYDKTISCGDMVIYVSEDDPRLAEYKSALKDRNLIIGPRKYLSEVYNYCACKLYPDYKYYHMIDDDYIMHSPRWDEVLINDIETQGQGWGIAFGRELETPMGDPRRFPSACVVSGNIIRALGYFITPLLQHVEVDAYLRDIGEGIGRYYRNLDVIIEHRHFIGGKAEKDDNYIFSTSGEQRTFGKAGYEKWCSLYKQGDIERINYAIKDWRTD